MKRILSIVLALVMALSLVACGSKNDDAKDPAADGEKQTVDFPSRDITMIVPFGAGGATDLICRTLAAEMEKELGVSIAVTNMPGSASAVGTEYVYEADHDGYTILGYPTDITSIKIKSGRMLLATGFLRKVFETFENYQTPIDMVTTSEVGVSVTIDNRKHLEEIVDDLKKYGTVTVDEDMVIVCVVGDLEWDNIGFEARIVQAMKDVPVRMISYGGSNYNVSLLIKASDKQRALQALSDHLFNNK